MHLAVRHCIQTSMSDASVRRTCTAELEEGVVKRRPTHAVDGRGRPTGKLICRGVPSTCSARDTHDNE